MVVVEPGSTADADAVVDLWVELADDQRDFGSHLFAEANRDRVRDAITRSAVAGELLVAREESHEGAERAEGNEESEGAEGNEEAERTEGNGEDERIEGNERDERTEERDAGEIVGFLTFATESGTYDQDVTRGVVQNIYVVADARSEGIGSDLLAEAERRMVAGGADAVSLEVMADNDAARRFYRRHGYSPHRVELEKSVESDTLTKE